MLHYLREVFLNNIQESFSLYIALPLLGRDINSRLGRYDIIQYSYFL
jgi:hypothetical protein